MPDRSTGQLVAAMTTQMEALVQQMVQGMARSIEPLAAAVSESTAQVKALVETINANMDREFPVQLMDAEYVWGESADWSLREDGSRPDSSQG